MAWKARNVFDDSWRNFLTSDEEKEVKTLDRELAKIKAEEDAILVRKMPLRSAFRTIRSRAAMREMADAARKKG